jgi:amphi-Trp domain-containing protein
MSQIQFGDGMHMEENEIFEAEKSYSGKEMAGKLRRLAEALDEGRGFRIQVAGRRVTVPADARIEIELEIIQDEAELEIEIKWKINLDE